MTAPLKALDLFAGTGWGVACAEVGIEELGVELMPDVVATREANGMRTIYRDVWEGLEGRHDVPDYDMLIASPPCQTFSMAGNGSGRRALDEVLGLIDSRGYLDVANLRAFGRKHDMRTALVLTPLAHVARDTPVYVVLEQVPPVLPVWERMAVEMREWGYSVVTGVLNAEQYGVPQTRKRAILIARADGVEARMPTPTHSRYYPNDKARLDEGVKKWVSMAEALGWGKIGEVGRNVIMVSNDKRAHSARRSIHEPAPTITGGHDTANRKWKSDAGSTSTPVTVAEAAALQTYPATFNWAPVIPVLRNGVETGRRAPMPKTKAFQQIGNAVPPLLARAVLSTILDDMEG